MKKFFVFREGDRVREQNNERKGQWFTVVDVRTFKVFERAGNLSSNAFWRFLCLVELGNVWRGKFDESLMTAKR
jgi:hypothetical protein